MRQNPPRERERERENVASENHRAVKHDRVSLSSAHIGRIIQSSTAYQRWLREATLREENETSRGEHAEASRSSFLSQLQYYYLIVILIHLSLNRQEEVIQFYINIYFDFLLIQKYIF